MSPYVIYGLELSYFTRKTEAAFELLGVPHVRKSKTLFNRGKLSKKGRTEQVPVVLTPTGQWMKDSTPIIEHLDENSDGRRLFPLGAEGVLPRLCEEWLDEWFPRAVIHFRWNYPECSEEARDHLARELTPFIPGPIRSKLGRTVETWGKKAARALALDSAPQQQAVEDCFERLFYVLDDQLKDTRFALGDRPCAVDAVLIGGIRAHLGADPEPRRRLEKHPAILAWADDVPSWSGDEPLCTLDDPNGFARFILEEMGGEYARFILPNAAALAAGQKAVIVGEGPSAVSYRARAYPETSRQRLIQWLRALPKPTRETTAARLSDLGLGEIFSMS
jgi:glutathione S-transferase